MLKTLVVVLGLFLLFTSSVFAAGFQLKSIGVLDVTGTMSKEWWYTTVNPPLSGITTAGSSVTVNDLNRRRSSGGVEFLGRQPVFYPPHRQRPGRRGRAGPAVDSGRRFDGADFSSVVRRAIGSGCRCRSIAG